MATVQELQTKFEGLTFPVGKANREAREIYRAQEAGLRVQLAAALAGEYASDLTARQQQIVFEKAWEDGHAYGYTEVENRYMDTMSFVDALLAR